MLFTFFLDRLLILLDIAYILIGNIKRIFRLIGYLIAYQVLINILIEETSFSIWRFTLGLFIIFSISIVCLLIILFQCYAVGRFLIQGLIYFKVFILFCFSVLILIVRWWKHFIEHVLLIFIKVMLYSTVIIPKMQQVCVLLLMKY